MSALASLILAPTLVSAPSPPAPITPPAPPPPVETMRAWVQEMKEAPRGPFAKIKWFCKDGAVLDPEPYACEPHGGGVQHGEWSERTKTIRAAGYPIANVLADLKAENVVGPDADPAFLRALLIEKFLVAFDDGWILHKAQYYRGAFQDYNERDRATEILLGMLGDPIWRPRFAVLREAVRLLPHGAETAIITEIRGLATAITEKDPKFDQLRNRIHITPGAGDARRVRDYAAGPKAKPELKDDYERLAKTIDDAYTSKTLPAMLEALAPRVKSADMARQIANIAGQLASNPEPKDQFRLSCDALGLIREHLLELGTPSIRLAALDASLNSEVTVFTASRALLEQMPRATRADRLDWIGLAARAQYGLGLITLRELDEVNKSLALMQDKTVKVSVYRQELQQLERAPGWAARRLAYFFGDAIEKLLPLEPLADMYIPDRLRSSPMLFYSSVLDSLIQDANRLAGTRHKMFGHSLDSGLRRLNPGLARGVLRMDADIAAAKAGDAAAIYLVPETTADLPPAAGILTADEGNALSHVQLLARNLGIPNVVVGRSLMPTLEAYRGKTIVLAASVGGVVQIDTDKPEWDKLLGAAKSGTPHTAIHVDVAKLNLAAREFLPLAGLGEADAGRTVGQKAAGVAELARRFPDNSSPGLVIPFGLFRALLDRQRTADSPETLFAWMQAQYAQLGKLKGGDPEAYHKAVAEFLAYMRNWIRAVDLGPEFKDKLRTAMQTAFGAEGSYGAFVRSDTNVEDLPGFTGAGLNKTIPNVVGFDNTVNAIKEVWASPFTERAYGWRQGVMDHPEHVYVSVLIHKSVPNEKSGVLVTADVDSGDRDYLTAVANAGVGGGVDGQLAESLRISVKTGEVRRLASATARTRKILPLEGGVKVVAAPAPDGLLLPEEITQLVELTRVLPQKYPPLPDATGKPAPYDVEFGFVKGRLMLLQIRPFVQNQAALRNQYLGGLDAGLRQHEERLVELQQVPPPGNP